MTRVLQGFVIAAAAFLTVAPAADADVILSVGDETVVAPSSGSITIDGEVFLELTDTDVNQDLGSYNVALSIVGNPSGITLTGGLSNSFFDNNPLSFPLGGDYGYFDDDDDLSTLELPGAGPTLLYSFEIEVDDSAALGDYTVQIETTSSELADNAGQPFVIDSAAAGTLSVVPEPGTLVLAALGLIAVAGQRRRSM